MKKILGMGNALTDLLFNIENDEVLKEIGVLKGSMQLIDKENAEELMHFFSDHQAVMATGGSASNAINGIAKLGTPASFIGKIGKDEIGKFFKNHSIENGVETYLSENNNLSGRCTVLVSKDGERTLCTFLGAAAELHEKDIDETVFFEHDIFHIEGYLVQDHELIRAAVKMAKEAGLLVSIDLASFNIVDANRAFLHEIVKKYVDITFANEEEAAAFSQTTPQEALNVLAKLCDIAVVKLGKDGSLVKQGESVYKIHSVKAHCVDTTGAGDMYAAGFLHGLAQNYPLDVCGKIGSLVSAKVVEVMGAKLSEHTWKEIYREIDQILKENPSED